MIIYVVKQGDSLYSIAQRFGVPEDTIIIQNELTHPNELVVGQTIVIITNKIPYTIKRGDRLQNIANTYGVSVEDILRINDNITNPNNIQAGETIYIPIPSQKLGSMEVNGYAFPNISQEVLSKTLPYLTYLSIFSYQVRPDGSLITINEQDLIDQARQAGVAPLMVITNIEEDGGFSGEITNSIFNDPVARANLIKNIVDTLNQKNYYGVDVDFEYIFPEDRENYNNFLRELTAAVHPLGYIVTTAVAPKISDDMQGVLYEGHDYKAHGEIVDHVIIMTYEWGYTFGEPMAVAPLNSVKQVLDYAVTVIPPEKILMGVPNYGYDWTLPYKPGTAARAVGNVGAVDIARENGAFIMFDQKSASPYFNYWQVNDNGVAKQHVVWFEDARSIDAKLRTAIDYNLGGVSYWTINRFMPQNWLVLDQLYDVIKILPVPYSSGTGRKPFI